MNWRGWIAGLILATLGLGLWSALYVSRVSVVAATAAPNAAMPAAVGQPEYAPGVVLVKVRTGVVLTARPNRTVQAARPALDAALAEVGARGSQPVFAGAPATGLGRVYRLALAPATTVLSAVAALAANPDLEWVEPDYRARPAVTPNDPLYAGQWGLVQIAAPAAWEMVTGTAQVVIAVVDSGMDTAHSDLVANLWVNPGEVPSNGVDDDNNGYVDDVYGWNFVSDDNDITDSYGHGTQVAGVLAAVTDNGLGGAGVCWHCRIMPVKVMADSGLSNYSDVAAGVRYAADKGAQVINLSLGGYAYSNALREAVEYATSQGAVVVGGAGNDSVNTPFYPAAYERVLAVAGTTRTDTKALSSNYGVWVDLDAPAVEITTTYLGGDWGPASGTSMAAPFVAGVAALIRSRQPGWSAALVRNQLVQTADPLDTLNPAYAGQLGAGRVNAAQAMQDPRPALVLAGTSVNGDPAGRPTPGTTVALTVTLRNDWWDATSVTGTLTTADAFVTLEQATASYGTLASGATGANTPVYTFTVAAGAGYNHTIPFTLAVTANGGAYTTTLPLTITTRSGDEPFCGTLAEDLVWTSDKRYIINCNVGVAPGYTLTIQAGTEVRFNGNYALNVGGALIADGTAAQPIRLVSHTGGAWQRLLFDDPSIDATADMSGTYQSGNLLRHVRIEGATSGISCTNATPYLDHITLTGGGVNCTLGTTSLWLQESDLTGNVILSAGQVAVLHTTTHSGRLSVPTFSRVLTCTVGGGITAGSDSVIQNTIASGGITINGSGIVADSIAYSTISLSGGVAQSNTVRNGGISVGGGSALSNTVTGGKISVSSGGTVCGNSVESVPGWGIQATGSATVAYNRVVGCASGIQANGGVVQDNLVANTAGTGLELGAAAMVLSNTFTDIGGSAVKLTAGTAMTLAGNNFEFNPGTYDVENRIPKTILPAVNAVGNWWGTTSGVTVQQRIFDFDEDYTIGTVLYSPVLTQPSTAAPAYVRAITLTPKSQVGIQTVAFEALFSREMDTEDMPALVFHTVRKGTWETFTTSNSELPSNEVRALATDVGGSVWVGTWQGGLSVQQATGVWETFTISNSGLADDTVYALAADVAGNVWVGLWGSGLSVRRAAGTWETFNTDNSGLNNYVGALAVDATGRLWVGTRGGGLSTQRVDGTWETFNTSNSGLASNEVRALAIDTAGNIWVGLWDNGLSVRWATGEWEVFTTSNSELANDNVSALVIDATGSVWAGTEDGGLSVRRADGIWETFTTQNSGLVDDHIQALVLDAVGNMWISTQNGLSVRRATGTWETFSTSNSGLADPNVYALTLDAIGSVWAGTQNGLSVRYGGIDYDIADNPQWLAPNHYRATYDFTTLVPRGLYTLTVSSAQGTDGIVIPLNSTTTFTVDYAEGINDITRPPAPAAAACSAATLDTLSAQWWASDPESAITLYQYAIGTTAGGREVVNWTITTTTVITHTNLTLLAGQTYYISVKARNAGGLWSEKGVSGGVVAGSAGCAAAAPAVDFVGMPHSGEAPLTVQFTSTVTGTVTTYAWDFGDGGMAATPHTTHTYQSVGNFGVTLVVTGPGGTAQAVKPGYITVTQPVTAPAVDFVGMPRSGETPLMVQFTGTVTGTATVYAWDFGDGGTAATLTPTHTYQSVGNFGVTLVVIGPGGAAQAVKPGYISVNAPAGTPTVTFNADVVSGVAPLSVTFTALTTGTVMGWHWDFGDGAVVFTGPVVQHTYQTPGRFTVSLTVSNTYGSYTVGRPEYITVNAPHQLYLPLVLRLTSTNQQLMLQSDSWIGRSWRD